MRNSSYELSNLDTILTLPWQTSVMALASSCREAGLAFMNESRHWGKAELAMWLIGPYAQILRYTSVLADRASRQPEDIDRIGQIDARLVDRILENARSEVISTLETLSSEEDGASFAFSMIAAEYVVHCTDKSGGVGWAPSGRPRRLADRVLSLFAADFLTRPAGLEADLSVCSVCGSVEFDRSVRARGMCARHLSVITANARRNTLPYFPDAG